MFFYTRALRASGARDISGLALPQRFLGGESKVQASAFFVFYLYYVRNNVVEAIFTNLAAT